MDEKLGMNGLGPFHLEWSIIIEERKATWKDRWVMVHIVKKGGEGLMVPSHLNFLYVGDSLGGGRWCEWGSSGPKQTPKTIPQPHSTKNPYKPKE